MYTGITPFASETKHLGWDAATVSGGGVRWEWQTPEVQLNVPKQQQCHCLGVWLGWGGASRGTPALGMVSPCMESMLSGEMALAGRCWATGPLLEACTSQRIWPVGSQLNASPHGSFPQEKRRRDGRGRAPWVCARAGHLGGAEQVQGRKDSSSRPFNGYFACITSSWNKYQWMI